MAMRIVVVGTSGSGKTTLGRQLAERLAASFIELDAINWQPGWRALHADAPHEFTRKVTEAVSAERWVCDGNYSGVRRVVWARATHLIWLDYDRPVIMARVVRRSFVRAVDWRVLWAGNRENWRHWSMPATQYGGLGIPGFGGGKNRTFVQRRRVFPSCSHAAKRAGEANGLVERFAALDPPP